MSQVQIAAPAKLNLHLAVGGKREDGFHGIRSIFLALDFGDTLTFRSEGGTCGNTELEVRWQLPILSGEGPKPTLETADNLVLKAAAAFRRRTGFASSLSISLEKRIPLGGGLGGGSSDAASTLLALNRLAGAEAGIRPLDRHDLALLGAELGSDVPFFIHCNGETGMAAALVGGRGEKVRPIRLPERFAGLRFVLVNPGFPSNTAGAFALLDESRAADSPTPDLPSELGLTGDLEAALSLEPARWPFRNDFLPALLSGGNGITYGSILSRLKAFGADFVGLSGSGSSCFGVFSDTELSRKAIEELSNGRFYVFETSCLRS
ncbi:MAG: 4-(cytidine 5'-diphospho)-2-C-methyl-D-erythritol kinase [Treponema sp.]|nr:4-(cytidine 5'-diphospho)-2-C-methyl-D-erythritol kinase [Treponema sp.]